MGVIPAQNRAAKAEQNKPGPTISANAENVRNTGTAISTNKKTHVDINLLRARHSRRETIVAFPFVQSHTNTPKL